jgi:hypothetical protein
MLVVHGDCVSSIRPPSSSGLGHHPLKVAARVRIPLGVRAVLAALYLLSKIAESVEMLLHYELRINEKLMNSLCSNFLRVL